MAKTAGGPRGAKQHTKAYSTAGVPKLSGGCSQRFAAADHLMRSSSPPGTPAGTQQLLLGLMLLSVVGGGALLFYSSLGPSTAPEVTPLNAPKLKELPELMEQSYRDSMLWGSYRSGLYFGMKTRTPAPLLMGLMWFDPDSIQATVYDKQLRHEARQEDKLRRYGWLRHDGRRYGRQELVDGDYAYSIQMLKHSSEGSGRGGDWALRITANKSQQLLDKEAAAAAAAAEGGGSTSKQQRRGSLILYMADSDWAEADMDIWPDGSTSKLQQGVRLVSGSSSSTGGPWSLHVAPGPTSPKRSAAARLHHLGVGLKSDQHLVQLKDMTLQALVQTAHQQGGTAADPKLQLPDLVQGRPSLAMLQLTFKLPASFDVVFTSGQQQQEDEDARQEQLQQLSGPSLTRLLQQQEEAFDSRFQKTFPIRNLPTNPSSSSSSSTQLQPSQVAEVAKAALSNLLGSMGYFYGASRVKLPPSSLKYISKQQRRAAEAAGQDPSITEYWPDALFTATPSRSFFPRGFLWDEGFHQLLVQQWDAQLSREALAHWLDLMNIQGWIPREQILGEEARARVPAEFIVQHPSHANPPSLFLPLLRMAERAQAAATAAGGAAAAAGQAAEVEFLSRAWPRLETWYRWFNTTQAGALAGSYRWHGRDATTDRELNPKTLMSGLDDYPRASHPTAQERHLDLLTWMALASDAMAAIGRVAGAPEASVAKYAAAGAALGSLQHLKALHWDAPSSSFLDWGLHTEAVQLVKVTQGEGPEAKEVMVRQVLQPPKLQYVPAFGYVSLFPLLMQLLPPGCGELGQQLALLRQEALLWTPYGLRSLAPTSSIYMKYNTEHDAPYWRGPIWMPMNFLAVRALKHYSQETGPHQSTAAQLYQELRQALLSNLVANYQQTGYLWEQYRDADGKGISSHPFTGWTALVTLIAAGVY